MLPSSEVMSIFFTLNFCCNSPKRLCSLVKKSDLKQPEETVKFVLPVLPPTQRFDYDACSQPMPVFACWCYGMDMDIEVPL